MRAAGPGSVGYVVTTADLAVVTLVDPAAFFAVTFALSVCPTSSVFNVYDVVVALMATHEPPVAEQRSQWYA